MAEQTVEYDKIPFKKGLKRRHTIMGLLMLPIALLLTVVAQIAIVIAYIPFLIDDLRETLDSAALNTEQGMLDAYVDVLTIIFSAPEFLTVSALVQFVAFILTVVLAKYIVSGRSPKHLFKKATYVGFFNKVGLPTSLDKTLGKHLLWGALLGVALWGGLQLTSFLVMTFTGAELESSETSQMVLGYGSWILMLIVVPIIAPIAEEIFFRGGVMGFLAYPDVKSSTRRVSALIISALLFSVMHMQGMASMMDVFVLFWTFTLGIVLGLSYLKTGKITAAIAAHIVYNGIQSLIVFFFT